MTNGIDRKTATMQGGGFYNRNSALQAANLSSAIPLLQNAVQSIPISEGRPIVVADYGSSQGRNSLPPMRTAIELLRTRVSAATPISIVHTDLPSNDFTSLFTILDSDPQSYLNAARNVFAYAVGRSYFDAVFPHDHVDLGWSSNALHWMSSNPIDVADHGWAIFSASEAARDAVNQRLASDWLRFLKARSRELRTGGQIVCQFLGRGPTTHGFEWMANLFWNCLSDMGKDGLITAAELLQMTNPSAGRSIEQIQAPFDTGIYDGLSLVHCSMHEAPDPFWDEYQKSGDAAKLGSSWAGLMRAANGPNFTAALESAEQAKGVLLDELSTRVAARVTANPQRSESYIARVVVEKLAEG